MCNNICGPGGSVETWKIYIYMVPVNISQIELVHK